MAVGLFDDDGVRPLLDQPTGLALSPNEGILYIAGRYGEFRIIG
jgi:hypothetical protein